MMRQGRRLLWLVLGCSCLLGAQQQVAIQKGTGQSGRPSSGGYQPPALSLAQLIEHDPLLSSALISFMQSGDSKSFRTTIMNGAQAGNVGAELSLAEEYIPEPCTFEPDQDAPHCGKSGNEPPSVIFRRSPLGIDPSYEEAAHWLEKASAQGSGEASEVLAQLITRMQANGHGTSYTARDSAHFHAIARSQGFDVEPIIVTCYKRAPGGSGMRQGGFPGLGIGQPKPLSKPFTDEELSHLANAGLSGSLLYEGDSEAGDSVLLSRPEAPVVHVRIILDHDPGSEVLLPIPAHHDVIYVQRGDKFLAFPEVGTTLPRFISIQPLGKPASQISEMTQLINGAQSGGSCASLP